jgi:DNA polymerase I-like protein with 3'-5' exonuclease and polymerase domains
MRILVNYSKAEVNHLTVLKYFINKAGLQAVATDKTLSTGELVATAQSARCEGIFLCNQDTLANCVPGDSPSLDSWRGSLLNFSVPTIVGNSLLHSHTVPYGSWLMEKDLNRFKSIETNKHLLPEGQQFHYVVIESMVQMVEAYNVLSKAEFISYDIETKTVNEDEENLVAGDTFITCCSWTGCFADRSLRTYVLPLVDFMEDHWRTDIEYGEAIKTLRRINSLPVVKAMHNGLYDCLHSIVYHAEPHQWLLDTMAMAHAEFSELPKSLDFVASITLPDYCQWKAEAGAASSSKDIQRYWAYNAKDTWTTARIVLHYLDKLPAYARKNYQMQFKLVYPILYCNFEGFKIDQEKRNEIRGREIERLDSNLVKLRTTLADSNFNPSSPKQVATYVYDILGAADMKIGTKKVQGKKVKNTRGTNEKNLKAVGEQHPILLRVTDAIIEYREARKAVSTYMDFLQKVGRLLYSINPFGTETNRMSCNSSSFWCGTQVQNIPDYAKYMLVADEGFILAEPDLSQSDARGTAYLAEDLALIQALEHPTQDFYTSLGTLFFGIPYEEVSKELRNKILKKIVHGTNYMMGAVTFIENAGTKNLLEAAPSLHVSVSLSQLPPKDSITLKAFASMLLESYHVPFAKVREWYKDVKHEIMTTKMLVSPLGHTRFFFGNVEKNYSAFNSAVAHGPQNLTGAVLNKGFWHMWQMVKREHGDFRLKAQIHDSAPFQYREGRTELRDEAWRSMNVVVKIKGRYLLIPVDCKEGKNWGDMEKLPRLVVDKDSLINNSK